MIYDTKFVSYIIPYSPVISYTKLELGLLLFRSSHGSGYGWPNRGGAHNSANKAGVLKAASAAV